MTRRVLALDHAGVLGGAEFSLLDVAAALTPDIAVRLFADGPFRAALERRGVDVRVLPMGALQRVRKTSGWSSLHAIPALWSLATEVAREGRSANVLYANSQKAFVVAALSARRCGRPVVWHLRDLLGPPHFSALNTRVVIALAQWSRALVIANSQATADAFIAAGGRATAVRVVHNGVSPAPFDAVTPDEAAAQRATISPGASQVLAVFARMHPWKGQHVALHALAQLPASCHLWIVGAPLFGEHAYEQSLHALAARLGVLPRVRFLGFRSDIAVLMRACDVVVHSSALPEPFGRSIVEGMLARRPVVATAAGGVPEIIEDGHTGLLVPPDDAAALARAIRPLLDDPARADALAAAGSEHARRTFGVERMIAGVTAALTEATR